MTLNNKVQAGDPTISTSTTTTSQWQTYTHPKAEQGWECPRCGRINAPWVRQCNCSRNNWTVTWTSDHVNFDPDWEKVTCADNVLNNPNTYSTTVGGSDYYNPSTCTYENTTRNINNYATNGKHYQGTTYTCEKNIKE